MKCQILFSRKSKKHIMSLSSAVSSNSVFYLLFYFLFVLRFYGPVNPMGSCQAWSVNLSSLLLGRFSPLSG